MACIFPMHLLLKFIICPKIFRCILFTGRREYDTAIAVGNRLYVFESVMNKNVFLHGALHCLVANPNDEDDDWTWLPLVQFFELLLELDRQPSRGSV